MIAKIFQRQKFFRCFAVSNQTHLVTDSGTCSTNPVAQGLRFCTASQKYKLRGPFWRGKKVISAEAQRVVTALKSTAKKDEAKLSNVLKAQVSRLIKIDLLSVLYELQTQNETELAIMVFNYARKEVWYKPDVPFYRDMINAFCRNGRYEEVHKLLEEMKAEGLSMQMIVYIEIMEWCIKQRNFPMFLEIFEKMKCSESPPNAFVYRTLINKLNNAEQFEVSWKLEKECQALDSDEDDEDDSKDIYGIDKRL